MAGAQNRQTAYLQTDDVKVIVEELLDFCSFASRIIQDSDLRKEFDKDVSAIMLSDIDEITSATRRNFPIQTED
jgi:hypothetical protein